MTVVHKISYYALRAFLFPFSLLPLPWIHHIGMTLGPFAYYLIPSFRKKTLSHLSLAFYKQLTEKELITLAKKSFGNLFITCLEYGKFNQTKDIHTIATCQNPENALKLLQEGHPPIFFCGHQANWEVLFLEGTSRMPGVAIGRPIKNLYLYDWITNIRQKYGGKMITPKNALKEGLRALKKGAFLGVVGDQGMPDSGFSSPFFGKKAWTSPLPALLAYRTGSPIIVAMTKRSCGHYFITYSEPLFPNQKASMEEEIPRLMKAALAIFEKSILETPEQWLWVHNRWKQQPLSAIKRPYRHESICIVIEKEDQLPLIQTLKEIYPYEFITLFLPKHLQGASLPNEIEVIFYQNLEEVKVIDYRFKLLFNFTHDKSITKHFKRLSVFTSVGLKEIASQSLKELICHAS